MPRSPCSGVTHRTHTHTHSLTHIRTHSHYTHTPVYHRWIRASKKREPILARLAIQMYQKWMGLVDRLDKNVALSRLRLKRCIKRYHRAIFVWYLATMLNNIMVLFEMFIVDPEKFKKSKSRIGYKHWFQNTLGNVLIDHGVQRAEIWWKNRCADVVTR